MILSSQLSAVSNQELKTLDSDMETEKALRARRDRILNDFAEKRAVVTDELLRELYDLNIQLGEA